MEQICGIYKITNLVNGKCYIGQSVNISSRWKQHTQSLDKVKKPDEENPLRRAFLKYGLLEQVSKPGIYGNFQFEVLLECPKEELTEKEYGKIAELQPEYNRMMCPPSEDRMWPRKQITEKCCYVQYHNFDSLGYLPFENFTQDVWGGESAYTVTKKRDALKLKGEKVYLIVGLKQKGHKQKDFFLWEYTLVEEVDIVDFGEGKEYGVRGTHYLCKKPIRLNDLPGFDHFAKNTMGSFAYGFQNVINDPFHEIIENEDNFVATKDSGMTCLEWLANFEDDLDDEDLLLTGRDDNDVPYWDLFGKDDKDSSFTWLRPRAFSVLETDYDFFIEQFQDFLNKNSSVKSVVIRLCENLKEFAERFPNIIFKVVCEGFNETWDEYVQDLSECKNVLLFGSYGILLSFPKKIGNGENHLVVSDRNILLSWPDAQLEEPPFDGWSRIQVKMNADFAKKRIYHIVKLARNGIVEYYLWNYLDVMDVEEENNFKFLWGPTFLCKSPIRLNDFITIDSNGSYNEENLMNFISKECLYASLAHIPNEVDWLCLFEEMNQIEPQWRNTQRNKDGKAEYM